MKTKNKAHNVATYSFQAGESILIDANVWLYLLPPATQPVPWWAAAYSKAFSRLLQAKAHPVVDCLILSEYLNRCIRIEYDASWKFRHPRFKDLRQSVDGAGILRSAVAEVAQILKTTSARDTPLSGMDLGSVLSGVQSGAIDFNDGLLIENCRINGWKLLTNDSDMTVGGIEVLTTSSALLKSYP